MRKDLLQAIMLAAFTEPLTPRKAARSSPVPSSVRWERSEYPHPKIPPHMKNNLFPDVLWLRIHGDYRGEEVTGWSRRAPDDSQNDQAHSQKGRERGPDNTQD